MSLWPTTRAVLATASCAMILLAASACNDNNDHGTTTANGSLAQVELGAPNGSVMSGAPFNIDVKARNAGFSVLHNSVVHVVLPPPLVVDSAEVTGGGGTVSFANGVNGATADYSFGTIDKNSQSTGTIHAHGSLPQGQNNVTATVTAQLTSDEVHAGDATARVDIVIQQ